MFAVRMEAHRQGKYGSATGYTEYPHSPENLGRDVLNRISGDEFAGVEGSLTSLTTSAAPRMFPETCSR